VATGSESPHAVIRIRLIANNPTLVMICTFAFYIESKSPVPWAKIGSFRLELEKKFFSEGFQELGRIKVGPETRKRSPGPYEKRSEVYAFR
jgi:hypothetical protein